jgi:hypothetical protein
MIKKLLITISATIFIVTAFLIKSNLSEKPNYNYEINGIEPMPIVKDDPFSHLAHGGSPIEQRDISVRKWISAGVKISVKGASGSGTIVYYDLKDGYAYVQSCGHLWTGNMNAEEARKRKLFCTVITWYHNEEKLNPPKEYPAEVLYYVNVRGQDCSLLRFKPDWIPRYFPISPPGFEYKKDMRLHSIGCDGGREIAYYDVRVLGLRGLDVVTTENSPRPGRSGGGLLSEDLFVGICWGTTDIEGRGNGLFTPLSVLRDLNEKNGFGWLNDAGISWARQIPIIDRNNPQGTYPPDYIPLPIR